jgi:Protein of unknown function (DUF2950)
VGGIAKLSWDWCPEGKRAPGRFDHSSVMTGRPLIATPARYGVTGIQTFIVSHSGVVYQRNLGRGTSRIAAGITAYDPDPGWQKV